MAYGGVGAYSRETSATSGSMTYPFYNNSNLQPLMGSFLYSTSASSATHPLTFTLSGLAAATYDIYLYSCANASDREAKFTVATSIGTSSVTIGPNTNLVGTLSEGITYELLQVAVGSDGGLKLTGSQVSGTELDLNGFQLQKVVVIPEPASMALLIFGAIGLLAYAWRKRRWRN
jgi:hypothetical protein